MSDSVSGRIVVVGDVMIDVLAALPGPLALGSDTPAPVTISPGGSAANTAAGLAALGCPVQLVGRVGDDEFGRFTRHELAERGVDLQLGVDPERPTGICVVLIAPDGERTMIPSAGANSALMPGDIPVLTDADRLHLSGYTLLNPLCRPAGIAALARAAEAGATISVDASSAGPLADIGPATFLSWLPPATMLLANADEAAVLSGFADPIEAASALARRIAAVIVKCRADGAVLATADGVSLYPTEPAAVVDSTGAGDAFAAGVLGALLRGAELGDAVTQGNTIAGRALGHVGGRPQR